MAGGSGVGHTRAMGAAARPSLETHSAEELRLLPCDEEPTDCSGCGMCAVRRPEDTDGLVSLGATRIGASASVEIVQGGEGSPGY